jgi:hypothetical protein
MRRRDSHFGLSGIHRFSANPRVWPFGDALALPMCNRKQHAMVTRMLSQIVTFRRPFVLDGFDQIEPAGTYTVDTEEESLDDVSFPVWKRNATVMHILHANETAYVKIDPEDLRKALERGAPQEVLRGFDAQ